MPTTRRDLLNAMAKLGGAGAVYETLTAWNFLKPPPAMAQSFELPKESGNGQTVAILGAGVSGLCAAYELDKAGYRCIVLEPTRLAGGRCWTIRRGDRFQEMPSAFEPSPPVQECTFDEGLYLNAGPGRIPHHHVRVLKYCRDFGVALEPYIFASRANLIHSKDGKTWPLRRPLYDLQGRIAELLDHCKSSDLELPASKEELESLHDMLVQFGGLSGNGTYSNAQARAGYVNGRGPGVAFKGVPETALQLNEILNSEVWNNWLFRDAIIYWQTSLMQPTGGMDMFVRGFLRQPLRAQQGTLEGLIHYGAEAKTISVGDKGVTVTYKDLSNGNEYPLTADYCISTIPMPIFKDMKVTGVEENFMRAAAVLPITPSGKVGWQAEDRFWEKNYNIYGGISWTNDDIDQIWYPSDGYLHQKGALTGAYMSGAKAARFNPQPVDARLVQAREQGAKLHPEFKDPTIINHGLAIAWERMQFERFAWANSGAGTTFDTAVEVLARPQPNVGVKRFFVAGDQITYWSGWMEGAIQAAWHATCAIGSNACPALP
jgi:monoamine oxidase